jgi:hypothetical protein
VRCLPITLLAACHGSTPTAPTAPRAVEVRDTHGAMVARVTLGHPCRATVGNMELIVGGPPLVADEGSTHWTGEDAPNGTTLRQNGEAVARIHANQLFDAQGVPLLRVTGDDIANGAGRILRTAIVVPDPNSHRIVIGDLAVAGLPGRSDDVALAAMLTASEASSEIRALAACHYVLEEQPQ